MSDERQEQFFLDQKEIEESLKICREIQEFNKRDRHAKKADQMTQGTRKEIDRILSNLQKEMKQDEDTGERLEESIRTRHTPSSAETELHLEDVADTEKFEEKPDAEIEEAYASGNISEEEYNERHPFFNALLRILICVAAAVLLALLITHFVAHHTSVEGSSMETTLASGDQLIVENVSYYFHDPERFDVVVFPFDDNTNYIKRVIGLPGETVQIKDGYVYINGNILDENYGRERINDPGIAENEIHLGSDEYFVLGDNRNASVDSRDQEVGLIRGSDIKAKAWLCFYPFSQVRFIE